MIEIKIQTRLEGYGYGRFSSKPQERGDSFDRQTKWIKNYAENNKINLLNIFFDEAISGKDGLNLEKEFGKLLSIIKPGQIILVETQERLGRQNPFALGHLIYETVNKGVEFRFSDGTLINLSNIDSLATGFNTFTKGALGRYEIIERGKKVHSSFVNRIEAAHNENKPFGHAGPSWVYYNKKTGCYEYNEEKIKSIQYIFRLASEKIGLLRICNRLNDENIPVISTRKNTKHWSRTSVNLIIKNKAVYGALETKDGRIKENHYRSIVSKELFYLIQQSLDSRKKGKGGGRPSKSHNLYKNLCKCHCGNTLMYISKTKKKGGKAYSYLVCHSQIIGLCKPYRALSYSKFDHIFKFSCLSNPEIIAKTFQSDKKELKSIAMEGELKTIENRLLLYQNDLETGKIELTNTLNKVILNLEHKIKELKNDLELQKVKEANESTIPNILKGYFKPQSNMFIVNLNKPEWTNDILKMFIDHIDVDLVNNTFTVELKDNNKTKMIYTMLP